MDIKEEIQNEVDNIKSQIAIAKDNGDEYLYHIVRDRDYPCVWSDQQINELFRGLKNIDAKIISHSEIVSKQYKNISLLFKIIYK